MKVEFAHSGVEGRMSPIVETAAFRIVQEALTNVARHAGVPPVSVRVWRDGESLSVQIADAGKGFDVAAAVAAGKSSGLSGMRERAAALGGKMDIDSTKDGTRLTAELPLPSTPAASKMGARA